MKSAYQAIAQGYFRQRDFPASALYSRKHLKQHPDDAQGWINLGKTLTSTAEFACAEHALLEGIRLSDKAEYYLDLQVLYALTNNDEKRKAVREILEERIPDEPRFIYNKAWDKIKAGDTYGGWADLEVGRYVDAFGSIFTHWPEKRLTDLSQIEGNRIAIAGEGGLGDEIIGARYAPIIRELGGTPILICRDQLHSILGHLAECRSHDDKGVIDYYVPTLGAVPVFKQIPNEVYLSAKAGYVEKHSKAVSSDKIKVGICWHGNTDYEWEQCRTVSKEMLYGLESDDVDVFSLQQDDTDLDLSTWEDTLGVIANLDMVISSCTAVVHAAGAMGKRVLVLVPYAAYYMWTTKEKWYADVTTVPRSTTPKELEEWIHA